MALKKLSKDYLLSSTPLQSPGDSGYFGSGHRRYESNSKVLGSCSPIKESTLQCGFYETSPPITLEKNLNFEKLSKNESLCSLEINDLSELEFTCPSDSGEHELHKPSLSLTNELSCNFSRAASHTSYSLNGSDIQYKIFDFDFNDSIDSNDFKFLKPLSSTSTVCDKNASSVVRSLRQEKIDFIQELSKRNCFSILSFLLSCLSAKELCIASCVSKVWNKVILSDSKANSRRKNLIEERLCFLNGPSKENRKGMKYGPAKEQKNVFSNLTNTLNVVSPKRSTVSNCKFNSFLKEAKNSKEKLIKCPSCSFASKCLRGNNYKCTRCSYHFCSQCFNPILNSHTCFKPQLPNIIVGSKRSKKNLRRL